MCVCVFERVAFLLALCVRNPITHTLLHAFQQIQFSLVFTFHRFSSCFISRRVHGELVQLSRLYICRSLQIQLFGFSLFSGLSFGTATTKPLFDAYQYCIVCRPI